MSLSAVCPLLGFAAEYLVNSPDGRIAVTVSDDGGRAMYEVKYDDKVFIGKSELGLVTNIGDFSRDLILSNVDRKSISESYELRNIKCSHVDYSANEMVCSFEKDGSRVMAVVFRVSNRDVAFRYVVNAPKGKFCCVVKEEKTSFRMPVGTTTFLCPQSKPMTGFAGTAPSYETRYTCDGPIGKNGWSFGYTFPCLFRNGDNGWVLLSETGTDGNYCGCRLLGESDGNYRVGFPMAEECNGWGDTTVQMALPGETPWRTITLGATLANIVETTVAWDLVKPKYTTGHKYEYGKGTWSWIIGMDSSCNFDEQRRYIDFAAAMGYRSVLIDALWDVQIGYDRIEQLAEYGRQKGVGLYLWYNSNGSWNHAPQSPRGIMNDPIKRKEEMRWMKKAGILGIKVDFFGGDKQMMMQLYEQILTDANDNNLLVIFHGCTLPRGWERMYPNYAASEAVLASENLHFSQGSCDTEAHCGTIHPFIRNTVGSMDFGGSALNKFYNANNKTGSRRVTTDVYALATAVLFQSPVQHFALAPNNLDDAPTWAIDFMKQVPTTWDEVRFVDGYPGRYVIMARRSGDKWYVAGINATGEPLKKTLALPMFDAGKTVNMYMNDKLSNVKVSKKKTVSVVIPDNGGVVITD
ncbi:glycoside hydrolase family 97 protein [Prevotella sp. PMUR]|uniref:Glycoside hydrolase family 97 protein n=2 Tax=Xylanibacter muris TaxID=2736290 RepID=A0ABX2ARY8_9BACT|nr:glycoside hydrolase family 97 protein [Xylanibacter muris]NPD92969.1 glycoside hydrolase family 97 protein [Xylanibacter muris]